MFEHPIGKIVYGNKKAALGLPSFLVSSRLLSGTNLNTEVFAPTNATHMIRTK